MKPASRPAGTLRPLRRTPAAALVLLATACTREPPALELFPLEAGHRWSYSRQTEHEDGRSESARLVMSTLPAEDFEGSKAFRRHSDDGADYWLRRDASGIFRVASRHELEPEARKDPAPRYVLKEPLAVGTEWQAPTVAYLLERRQGFPAEVRYGAKPVMMRYVIEALNDTMSVPAGRFEGCVRVRGQATIKLYADAVAGWKDMPLTTTEWYCPGPGLVKLERSEPAHSPFLTGGTLSLELTGWERP